MKKILILMSAVLFGLTGAMAMSYEEARDRARFLTDKMAYELNLNDAQYNDAYEINLDYLMNIRTESDAYGMYWEYRNADLRHILYDWQYSIFHATAHFLRPVVWSATGWFLPVYNIYPVTRFYYKPPRVYHEYRGGHYNYRFSHPASFYANRRPVWNGGFRGEYRGSTVGQPGRPSTGRQPGKPQNAGFRFEPVGNRPQGTAAGRQDNGRRNERTTQPTQSRPQTSRGNTTTGTRSRVTESNYNRPSSTRTTVNRTPQNSGTRTTRTQSTSSVQRGTSRSTSGRSTATPQRSGSTSRSRR